MNLPDDRQTKLADSSLSTEATKVEAVVNMPAVGKTLIFPRDDNAYRKFQSIPYDEQQSNVWRERPSLEYKETIKAWMAHLLTGLLVGCVAFCMNYLEENIVHFRRHQVLHMINQGH